METLKDLKAQLENATKQIKNNYSVITGVDVKNIGVCNDNFITFKAETLEDVKKVLTTLQPHKNSFKIDHKQPIFLTTEYKIDIENNYYKRELRIAFEMLNEVLVWININIENLPQEFKEKHLKRSNRNLYDTETVYVNLQSHSKEFKEIKIPSYEFNSNSVSWYGGNKTLINEQTIKDIINDIKN